MLLKCEDCMVTFESESLKDCPSCGTTDFIYQLSAHQVLAYENQKLKKENKDLLSANINMHDALDLKSERIQELKNKLATAVEALKDLVSAQEQLWTSINGKGLVDEAMDNAKQALAEIGGEDER